MESESESGIKILMRWNRKCLYLNMADLGSDLGGGVCPALMYDDLLPAHSGCYTVSRMEHVPYGRFYDTRLQRRSQVSLAGGGGLTEFQGGINLNTYSYGKRDSAA